MVSLRINFAVVILVWFFYFNHESNANTVDEQDPELQDKKTTSFHNRVMAAVEEQLAIDEELLNNLQLRKNTKKIIRSFMKRYCYEWKKEKLEKEGVPLEKEGVPLEKEGVQLEKEGIQLKYCALQHKFDIVCKMAKVMLSGGVLRFLIISFPVCCLSNVDIAENRQTEVHKTVREMWKSKQTDLENIIKSLGNYTKTYNKKEYADLLDFQKAMSRLQRLTLNFENSPTTSRNIAFRDALFKLVHSPNTSIAFNSWVEDKDSVWMHYMNITTVSPLEKVFIQNITRKFTHDDLYEYNAEKTEFEFNEFDYVVDIAENGYILTNENFGKHYSLCMWTLYTEHRKIDVGEMFTDIEKDWIPRFKSRSNAIHHFCETEQVLYDFLTKEEWHEPMAYMPIEECKPDSLSYERFIDYLNRNNPDMGYVCRKLLEFNKLIFTTTTSSSSK